MKRYLICIKDGVHPCGTDATIITHYKAMRYIRKLATNIKNKRGFDSIYLIEEYTQKMCEMDNATFVDYIENNGILII